jgi:ABC-type polysaccharide/polyol phosphate export permease
MINEQRLHLGPEAEGADSAPRAAWRDFLEGVQCFSIWGMLAWHDIRQRYRWSVIGPFWLTISTAIMVGALGFVYSGLFNQDMSKYLPFIAVGLIVWGFISSLFSDACAVFVSAEGMLKQIRLPLSVHVCRMVWRNFIIFAHNSIIIVIVMFWAQTPITWELLLVPVALFFICFNGVNIGLLLGVFCTRFRDISQLVASLIQVLFFVTPIMWSPAILSSKGGIDRAWIADYNPIYHFIQIIRAPILGEPSSVVSWSIVLCLSIAAWLLAMLTLTKLRHRVAYWL